MDDKDLKPGDHIEVFGVISFLNDGRVSRTAIGECQIFLCQRMMGVGFWRARALHLPGNPQVIVHRTAFSRVIDGEKSYEIRLEPKPGAEGGCYLN